MNQNFDNRMKEMAAGGRIKIKEPLYLHTTFKIGGPADYFAAPRTKEELKELITLCREEGVPYYIIGNGSNLLAGDRGFRGVILCIGDGLDKILVEKDSGDSRQRVKAGAGVMLSKLAAVLSQEGLAGFEFAAGIPGTLGGAVTMNAGAYGGELKDVIEAVCVMDELGELSWKSREELDFGYRTSAIPKNHWIVLEVSFEFHKGNQEEIQEKIKRLNQQRREKQPLEYPSAGSTFKRPEGYFAGKLIMDAGLRGFRIGDMMVSEKHCGFVINAGNGTAEQANQLMQEVDRVVYKKFGVHLEPEVKFLGE